MRQKLAWLVFAVVIALGIYGFVHERLLAQESWLPLGRHRFVIYLFAFGAAAIVVLILRANWVFPISILGVLGYTVWYAGLLPPLAVIFFVGSCWLLGRRVFPGRDAGTSICTGVGIWILVFWVLVHFPINTPALYATLIAIPWIASHRQIMTTVRTIRLPQLSKAEYAASVVLLFVLSTHWLVSMLPETGADALGVHLAAPMLIRHEGIWAFDFARFSWALMPMGVDWIYTAEYFLGGETAARLFNFAMLALNTWMVFRLALRGTTRTIAILTAALFCSTPLVQSITGHLMTDNTWALFILSGVTALVDNDFAVAGVLLGSGFAVKLGTIAFVIPAALWAGFVAIRQKLLRPALLGLALLLVFALPTYVGAWVRSGNPIYPYMNHIFKAPAFDSTTPFADARYHKPLTYRTPYAVTFQSTDYYEAQKGGLGFQYFLLGLPALIAVRRRRDVVILGIALVGALLTFTSQANLRYLYPAALLSSSVITEFVSVPMIGVPIIGALIALNLSFLPAADWGNRDFVTPSKAWKTEYREKGFPERTIIEFLNTNAPGQAAAFFGGDSIAGFQGRAYTDTWHTYEFWNFVAGSRDSTDLLTDFRGRKINYVVAPTSKITGYDAADKLLNSSITEPVLTSGPLTLYKLQYPEHPQASAVDLTSVSVPAGQYDLRSPELKFEGFWLHRTSVSGPERGTVSFSNQSGAFARLHFTGSSVVYKYTKAYNRGVVQVLIDGKETALLDEYAPGIHWQQETRFEGLSRNPHEIEIRVTRTKNAKSEDYFAEIDELIVVP
jgi:hypothetical protein